MTNIPKTIFLQVGEDADDSDFNDLAVTWSDERIYDNDLEYFLIEKEKK